MLKLNILQNYIKKEVIQNDFELKIEIPVEKNEEIMVDVPQQE